MSEKTPLNNRTLYTKCYETLSPDAQSGAPDVRGQFLLATQSAPSGLWRITTGHCYDARHTDGTSSNQYQFTTGQNSQGRELLDVMQRFAAFEAEQKRGGATERESFTFQNALYYRDMAMLKAIVFDVDTGVPTYLENGTIPQKDGDYEAADIALAAHYYNQAYKAEMQRLQNPETASPLDDLLSPYAPQEVDFDTLFKTLNARNSFDEFCNALSEAEDYLNIIAREKVQKNLNDFFRGKAGKHAEVTKGHAFIYPHKSFINASGAAYRAYSSLPAGLAPHTQQYLQDALHCFALTYEVLNIKIDFLHNMTQNNMISATDFEQQIDTLCEKRNISLDAKAKLQRACLDIGHIEVPPMLTHINKTLQTWNKAIDSLSARHLEDIALKGRPAQDLRPVMFKGSDYSQNKTIGDQSDGADAADTGFFSRILRKGP